ncbi:MAG: PQQ-like beta-propeller repeat protein [Fuerstiella sp.]
MKSALKCFLIVLTCSCSVPAEDSQWNRFRGPNGSGISSATTVPTQWTEADYRWTAELPGRGHSSPVCWNSQVYVTAADPTTQQRSLICLDVKSGATLWIRPEPFDEYRTHKNNSYASSTPCTDRDGVYAIWHGRQASPLIAYDHDGNERWRIDLGGYTHGQGGATSPIVEDGVVYVAHDQKPPSFLYAISASDGSMIWKLPRAGKRACYSTPCLRTTAADRQEVVFTHCFEGVSGHDLRTGQQLWLADVFGRSSQRALGSPVLTDELVIATSGAVGGDRQLVAVRPTVQAEQKETPSNADAAKFINAAEAYRTIRQTPHVPTPLVVNDLLFLVSDQGIASCLHAASGESIWKQRLGGTFFASPICINNAIYCVDVDGQVTVFAAEEEFSRLGKMALGEGSKATPAVAHGMLLLRTETKLIAIDG